MALFKEKEKITRKEFRDTLRKKNPVVPGTYKRLFSFEEREKMEERLFGKKKTGEKARDDAIAAALILQGYLDETIKE